LQSKFANSLVTLHALRAEFINAYLECFSPAVRAALQVTSIDSERTYLAARLAQVEATNKVIEKEGDKNKQAGKIFAAKEALFFYCIFDTVTKKLIGAIEIRSRDEMAGQLYCWIHENYWGLGHFQQALTGAAQDYFDKTYDRFFTAHVDVTNLRSYAALRKAGFAPWGFHQGPHGKQHVLVLRKKMHGE
jgi:RimJ/RimL family protein N-acetyltransferase